MISDLLTASHGKLLVPLAIVLALAKLATGLFGLHRSKSQDRKNFLELWRAEAPDDLWLEVAVRHLVGEYLPAALIRSLRTSPQAGRALIEVSECWPLIEMDDETGEIRWRSDRYSSPKKRRFWRIAFSFGYYAAVGAGVAFAYALLAGSTAETPVLTPVLWVYPIGLVLLGMWCLWSADRLKVAGQALPRWLGLP